MSTEFYDESQAEAAATTQIEHDKAVLSNHLYHLYQQMKNMRLTGVDDFIRLQCSSNELDYPPKRNPST